MTKPLRLTSIALPSKIFLETKLLPPGLKENVIFRPRILHLLDQHRGRKLILIVTDAGYGKTTLLTQFLRDRPRPAVYINLDRKDSAFLVFFTYLIRGLEKIDPALVTQTKTLLLGGSHVIRHYQLLMNSLINELAEKIQQETYFIFDDYHHLTENSIVHRALDYLIEYLPEKIRVIIASRLIPPFPHLAKWRAKQDLFEIYRDAMRFTEEEIKRLCDSYYNHKLSPAALKMVFDKTEGWITGIQLILYSAVRESGVLEKSLSQYTKTHQPLFEYFTRDILATEKPTVQNFLKRSSILETMTAQACNRILGLRHAGELLRLIKSRNLFLNAIGDDQYQYHPLFREFLLRQLIQDGKIRPLHQRAARYYARQGQWELVIEHSLAAGDYLCAARLIIKKSGLLLSQARYDLLQEWLNRFPDQVLQQHPRLVILHGRLHYETGQLTKANELYSQAENLLSRSAISQPRHRRAWLEVLFERGSLFLSEGHYQEALKYLHRARQVCPAGASEIRGDIFNQIGLVWDGLGNLRKARFYLLQARKQYRQIKLYCALLFVECNLALLLEKQGKTRALHAMFKSLIERLRVTYCWKAGHIFANAGKNALEMGNEEWAEQCLNEGLRLGQEFNDQKSLAGIHAALGALNLAKGNWDQACHFLDLAASEYQRLGWPRQKSLQLYRIRLFRYQDNRDALKKLLNPIAHYFGHEKMPLDTALEIEYALYEKLLGRLGSAQEIIKKALNLTQATGWKKEEFLAHLALAGIYLKTRGEAEARREMETALALSRNQGYDGILKCELRQQPELLQLAQQSARYKTYITSLQLSPRPVSLYITMLGGLTINDEYRRPVNIRWLSEKSRSLFAFMALNHETPLHREMILEQLWSGMDLKQANVNFRNTATRLRQAIFTALNHHVHKNNIFVFRNKKYQLLDGIKLHLDIDDFETLVKEAEHQESPDARARLIFRAMELYRGDFLPEIYETWSDILRRRLREKLLNHLQWLAQHTAKINDDQACVTVCDRYLSLEPFSEEIVSLCLQALAHLGQKSSIKSRYENFRRLLQKELRTTPSNQIHELYCSLIGSLPR